MAYTLRGFLLRASCQHLISAQPKQALSSGTGRNIHLTEHGIHDNGHDILHVESRNLCRCDACFGKYSQMRQGYPEGGDFYPRVRITDIGRVSDDYLSLRWSDGHEGLIARTPRGEYGPDPVHSSTMDKFLAASLRQNSAQRFWKGEEDGNCKKFDYNTLLDNLDDLREFFVHYMTYGIAFLSGVPREQGLTDIIPRLKFGPVRHTIFGDVDAVRFKPRHDNVGYGRDKLGAHHDLTYYQECPGIQAFQCVENTVQGGESFWVDTFSAVQEVRQERPDYFQVLAETPIFYRHTPPGRPERYTRAYSTLVCLVGDNINQVTDNLGALDVYLGSRWLDLTTRAKWWDAFLYYRSKVEDEGRWIERRLEGGEVVLTDNWRVCHGRREFRVTAEGQERIVETAYAQWNHMQSVVLSGIRAQEPCFLETDHH